MESIKKNLDEIQLCIQRACQRTNRDFETVQLIAVTKTIEPERMNMAIQAGVTSIGENKVQEVLRKKDFVSPVKWHLIGHLQTNKVRQIIEHVELIHSVDSKHLAQEIQKRAEIHNRVVNVLIEVNVAQEDSKFGLTVGAVPSFLETLKELDRVQIKGLMTVAPFLENSEDVRIYFKRLKQLFDSLKGTAQSNVTMEILSMGMTNDYEVAIEEGSTMVRIGTGIFGARDYSA